MGPDRSAAALPGVPAVTRAPDADRVRVKSLPGVVRHGADVPQGTRTAACSGTPRQFVLRPTLARAGPVVERSFPLVLQDGMPALSQEIEQRSSRHFGLHL